MSPAIGGRLSGGDAHGIKRAICERYIAEGAWLAVADIDLDEAQVTASMLVEPAFAVALDVTKQESIDAMVDTVVKQAGGVDILVNNAAILIWGRYSRKRRAAAY